MQRHTDCYVFLFPGQGVQYVDMARGLYDNHEIFNNHMNIGLGLLQEEFGIDLKSVLYPEQVEQQSASLDDIVFSTCSIFLVEYALASMLIDLDIKPVAMLGYSIGEYVAACIGGVMSLRDALRMTVVRSRLMAQTSHGKMISVALRRHELKPILPNEISIAADLGASCVLAGAIDIVEEFEANLRQKKIFSHVLNIGCAGHSSLLDPILPSFIRDNQSLVFSEPKIPFISNVTGDFISTSDAQELYYWVRQMRQPVLLEKGLRRILDLPQAVFLEVGPGHVLSMQIMQINEQERRPTVLNLIQPEGGQSADIEYFESRISSLKGRAHVFE